MIDQPRPNEGVYRTMARSPRQSAAARTHLEVVVTWGDEVLAVSHLRPSERYVLSPRAPLRSGLQGFLVHSLPRDHGLVEWEGDRCFAQLPEDPRGWTLEGADHVPLSGRVQLDQDQSLTVRSENVTLRLRRVAPPPELPAARRTTVFHALVAAALAAVTPALASLSAGEAHPAIKTDDNGAQWLNARIGEPRFLLPSLAVEAPIELPSSLCGCSEQEGLSLDFWPHSAALSATPGVSVERVTGLLPERSVRRVLARSHRRFEACVQGLGEPERYGLRVVVDARGVVIRAASDEFDPRFAATCLREAASNLRFPAVRDAVTVVVFTFTS